MALYVDSADRQAVERLLATGLFAGVTTNPALISKAGLTTADRADIVAWTTNAGAQTVFVQALGVTEAEIVRDGLEIARLGPNVVVKVVATRAGLAATKTLTGHGVTVLTTAVYHATQALLAAAAGASFIAPYVGRMTDNNRDGIEQSIKMARILDGTGVRVLAASLRSADDVAELAAAGIPDFAISADLLEKMLADDLSVTAAKEFEVLGGNS